MEIYRSHDQNPAHTVSSEAMLVAAPLAATVESEPLLVGVERSCDSTFRKTESTWSRPEAATSAPKQKNYRTKPISQKSIQIRVFGAIRRARHELGDLARLFVRAAWRALGSAYMLPKLLLRYRPYEAVKGSTDTRRDRSVPLIGIVGEIFCRLHAFSNENLVRRLEEYEAEAWISDLTAWVWYTISQQFHKLKLTGRQYSKAALGAWIRRRVQKRDEHVLLEPFKEDFLGYEEPDVAEVLEAARPYLPREGALGEMVLNVGKAVCLARRGVDGIIDISPFTCMNGIVCEAVYPRVSRDLGGLPIRNFYFDGTQSDLDRDLGVYLELARSYQRRKQYQRRTA